MVEITPWRGNGLRVSAKEATHEGLMIHGYGSSSLEMMGLAVALAKHLPLSIFLFDLPGHGSARDHLLTADAGIAAARAAAAAVENPAFVIGHSLGARLALQTDIATAVLLSMPGAPEFEGSRQDLLKVLRPRRVNEPAALKSLAEILSGDARPAPRTLFLTAANELRSVRDAASAWRGLGVEFATIRDSHHNDIISSNETLEVIGKWLPANLA